MNNRRRVPRSKTMAILCMGLAALSPAFAFDAKARSAPGSKHAVTTPTPSDLADMARKLGRAQIPNSLAKAATFAPSALANHLRSKTAFGPQAPLPLAQSGSFQGMRIERSATNGTPVFMEGPGLQKAYQEAISRSATAPDARAIAYLQSARDLFRLKDPKSELVRQDVSTDALGSRHERFQQMHQGIPVWGGSIHVHMDKSGQLYAVNARYSPTASLPTGPGFRLTAEKAIAMAKAHLERFADIETLSPELRILMDYQGPTAERNVWMETSGQRGFWAWRVEIRPNFRDHWRYFIDASTGIILEKYNATNSDGPQTATANDLSGTSRSLNTYQIGSNHFLIDATKKTFNTKSVLPNEPKGALWTLNANQTDLSKVSQVVSTTNTWSDAAAVSAHFNLGRVFDYYFDTFGRLGIDGAGSTMISAVHVTENGKAMDNAYWNGKFIAYGDGDKAFMPLARALDVAAHEMTHGVIDATVNLEYKFQSGALNESLADVFGAMVDREDWKLGEDAVNPTVFPSGAMRDMENPHNGGTGPTQIGWQPAHMNEFQNLKLEDDNGGVHVNSGIPNRACFLVSKAIGRDKTEKIYYRVMEAKYLNPGSQFIDMRLAAIRAATDLFGESSTEVAAVKDAFGEVGIGSASTPDKPTPRPEDVPPVSGLEFVAMVNADPQDNSIYIAKPVVAGDTDIVQLSATQAYTHTGNPIAITDDGSLLLFIDSENNMRGIDELGEQVVDDNGIWKSIAISPKGDKIAATTLEADGKIYILDLVNPNASKTIDLYTPTTGFSVRANNIVYADALDFNSTGDFLLYDALNRLTQTEGDSIEYWDANLLDIQTGIITPFLPARPEGISIGNPSFAQTNDLNLTFDLFNESAGAYTVVTADLFNGTFQIIDSGGLSAGFPRYSTTDDKIVYERTIGDVLNVQQVALAKDKITPSAAPSAYVKNAQKPVWFAIGKRPSGIRLPGTEPSQEFSLRIETHGDLAMELTSTATVTLTAFDVTGRHRATVWSGRKTQGKHRIQWPSLLGPGLYFIHVQVQSSGFPMVSRFQKVVRAAHGF